ncbi:MAG: L-threonylcarbamoyladenylate synthase [Terracidiphilus sp.]
MKTLRLKVDANRQETPEFAAALEQAAQIVRAGGLVALPTETVYGLGANALDAAAVERIFAAKGRPKWDPIIVHVSSLDMARELVSAVPDSAMRLPNSAVRLMDAFWPGPLTLLLPRSAAVPDVVTAGRPLVGLRMPAHPVALELIRRAGVPIAAPSANRFSHVSPTTAAHVLHDLDGRIDAVLDAGPALHGVESTVLDPNQIPMLIYRPGAVTAEMIQSVAGPVEMFAGTGELRETPAESLPSPGVGLRHYAPKARLVLIESAGTRAEIATRIAHAALENACDRVGVMLPAGIPVPEELFGLPIFAWGQWDAPEEMAQSLYAGLRALDEQECTVILCPVPPHNGIGVAIRDRLRKAANRE